MYDKMRSIQTLLAMVCLVNTDKTKIMIIKSKKDTYANFVYKNNNLEEVSSYKYLSIDIHHKLNQNYSIEKRINGGWKSYFGLENNCKATNLVMWDKKNLVFETLVTRVILYGCEVQGCSNTPYPILHIEVGISPIEILAMTRLLLYTHEINNMGDHRLPKLALNSSQNVAKTT